MRTESAGIRVRLTRSDRIRVTLIVIPTSPSQTPISSSFDTMIGAKTMIVVRVEAAIARPTSRVPRIAAWIGE